MYNMQQTTCMVHAWMNIRRTAWFVSYSTNNNINVDLSTQLLMHIQVLNFIP